MPDRSGRGSPVRVAALLAGYGVLHSALASRRAKDLTARLASPRTRNGLYRPFFIVQSLVTALVLLRRFARLPDRTLYHVPRPWSWLLRVGQAAGVGLTLWAAGAVGFARISGAAPLARFLAGRPTPPEPEAQGPRAAADGGMLANGPFRHTRHPANWGPIPVFWLCPRMTVNRLTLAALATAYLVLGSVHEEMRLRAAYGRAYSRYRRDVPFLLPLPRPRASSPATAEPPLSDAHAS